MISLTQHKFSAARLLARRYAAAGAGRLSDAQVESLIPTEADRFWTPGECIAQPERGGASLGILMSGLVAEARALPKGRRQILSLRLPGEPLVRRPGEYMVALSPAWVMETDHFNRHLADPAETYQPLRRGWFALMQLDQSMLRDQIVRVGRMSAVERLAHLVLELHERLVVIGLATNSTFHMPLKQETLGDVLGLSVVHINRTLQTLRRDGMVTTRGGYLTIVDRPGMVELSGYESRFPVAWRPEPVTRS